MFLKGKKTLTYFKEINNLKLSVQTNIINANIGNEDRTKQMSWYMLYDHKSKLYFYFTNTKKST